MYQTLKYIYSIIIFLCLLTGISQAHSQIKWATIAGKVNNNENIALPQVNILIVGTTRGTASNEKGQFRLENLKPGEYTLKFMSIGYQDEVKKNVMLRAGQTLLIHVIMQEKALRMQEIVVSPGNFSISQKQTAKQQAIQKEEISAVPATLDDICRILQIMPGVTFSDDFSAHFHVRGGKQNENLILLDGMEIYDPYHLKHIGGAVGVMNMELIENVAILTGGFPAKYGDKLSSVVAVNNKAGAVQKFQGRVSAGGTGASIIFQGPSPRGSWLLSARKSFLKEAAKILNPTDYTYSPSFYDIQSKVVVAVNPDNQIIANLLFSRDDSYLEKWRRDSELYSNYGNSYYGLVWKNTLGAAVFSEIIFSQGQNFWDNRIGIQKNEKLRLTESVFKWSTNLVPHPNHDLEWGVTYKYIRYDYELKTEQLSTEQRELEELIESFYGDTKINPRTYKFAAFLQDKFKLWKAFYANMGLRYDYFEYNQDQQWSPRVGLSLGVFEKTILRAAWGYYYQSPVYTELTDKKGKAVNPQAQRSIHYVLGCEQQLTDKFNVRIEAYQKKQQRMIGHYIEIREPPESPILHYGNPNSGLSRGIELFLTGKLLPQLSLWFTYAYSNTDIEAYIVNWEQEVVEKKTIPRFTDQPHNLTLFMNYKMPNLWELNFKWRYLSGIPYTPKYPVWIAEEPGWKYGELYSARYPAYHRLDFRLTKNLVYSGFRLKIFLEIKNLYNHRNVLFYDYEINNGVHNRKIYATLPFLPTIEFSIDF